MDIKRSLSEIKKNWKSLWWWQDRFVQRIIVPLIFRSNNGHYIFDEQWDNLVILDSCRYDTFKEVVEEMKLEGKLESIISRGTNTATFLLENFCDDRYDNIVYITANPYVNKLLKGKFYKIIPVWDKGWDDKLGTVHPEKVYEYTLNALRKYHDKKFIIHFLQPHIPFISYNSFSARAKESVEELRKATIENRNISVKYPKFKPFRLFDEGSEFYLKMPKDKLLQAYKDEVSNDLCGKTFKLFTGQNSYYSGSWRSFWRIYSSYNTYKSIRTCVRNKNICFDKSSLVYLGKKRGQIYRFREGNNKD